MSANRSYSKVSTQYRCSAGPVGPAGATGTTGQDGHDGAQGIAGPAGPTGPAGTSVAGGSSKHVQYNNGGIHAGSPFFTFDETKQCVELTSSSGGLTLNASYGGPNVPSITPSMIGSSNTPHAMLGGLRNGIHTWFNATHTQYIYGPHGNAKSGQQDLQLSSGIGVTNAELQVDGFKSLTPKGNHVCSMGTATSRWDGMHLNSLGKYYYNSVPTIEIGNNIISISNNLGLKEIQLTATGPYAHLKLGQSTTSGLINLFDSSKETISLKSERVTTGGNSTGPTLSLTDPDHSTSLNIHVVSQHSNPANKGVKIMADTTDGPFDITAGGTNGLNIQNTVTGDLQILNASGKIAINNANGDTEITNTNGSIELHSKTGYLKFKNKNNDIFSITDSGRTINNPALCMYKPLNLHADTTANLLTTATEAGDMVFDTVVNSLAYVDNDKILRSIGSSRVLRTVTGSRSLTRGGLELGTFTGVADDNNTGGYTGKHKDDVWKIQIGPSETASNTSQTSWHPSINAGGHLNQIYGTSATFPVKGHTWHHNYPVVNTASHSFAAPLWKAPTFRPILCAKCRVPPRNQPSQSNNINTDLELSVRVSGVITVYAHPLDEHPSGTRQEANRAIFSIGVFATPGSTDSIAMPNNGVADENNYNTGSGNSTGSRGNSCSGLSGGGGGGGLTTWPRPMHASYYMHMDQSYAIEALNQSGNVSLESGYHMTESISSTSSEWIDPLGFRNNQNTKWDHCLAGNLNIFYAGRGVGTASGGGGVGDGMHQGAWTVPFDILCNNVNTSGDYEEQNIWLTIDAPYPASWTGYRFLEVYRDGYGFGSVSASNRTYERRAGSCSMTVEYLEAGISTHTSDA